MDNCELPGCSNTFKRRYSQGGKRKRFCSRICRWASVPLDVRACKTCGTEFSVKMRSLNRDYCSPECRERTPCVMCGKTITGKKSMNGALRRFCSRQCSASYRGLVKSELKYSVKGFIASLDRTGKISCENCGEDRMAALQVHHIDMNRRNNSFSNLKTLCANCHSIVHWDCSENRKANILNAHMLHDLFTRHPDMKPHE